MYKNTFLSKVNCLPFVFFSSLVAIAMTLGTAGAETVVSGTIATDMTWALADSPFLMTGSITVDSGATLTVESGVVVKVDPGLVLNVASGGGLNVLGTSGSPVYITDYRDDSVGGDTNGDGSATSPAAGGWGGIRIADGGSASLSYLELRYGGGAYVWRGSAKFYPTLYKIGNSGTVTADNLTVKEGRTSGSGVYLINTTAAHSFTNSLFDTFAGSRGFFLDGATNVTIQDSIIRNAGAEGIYMENSGGTISGNTIQGNTGSGMSAVNSTGTVSSNTFQDNTQYGFHAEGVNQPSLTSNIFSNNTSGPVGLKGDAAGMSIPDTNILDGPVFITGGATTVDNNLQSPFVYEVINLTVGVGTTLTVTPPRVVKFASGAIITVNGTLSVPGTETVRVYFTDSRDDTLGGDTNGDGSATSPAPGGWGGIRIADGGSAGLSYLEMRYGGGAYVWRVSAKFYPTLYKIGNSGTITADNLAVKENRASGSGVYLVNTTAAHSFTNSLFDTFAGSRAFFLDGATNVIIQDSIIRNAGFDGIYMEDSGGTISGNTISNNGSSGMSAVNCTGTVSSNTFQDNSQYGFHTDGTNYQSLASNTFSNNASGPVGLKGDAAGMSIPATNTLDGPVVITGGTTTGDINLQSPFVYQVINLTVGAGTTLTVTPPRVIKFATGGIITVNGELSVPGTETDRVYFTDSRDDTLGGDTNSDGLATSPAPGGWGGIRIANGGSAGLSYLEMRYGGGAYVWRGSAKFYPTLYKLGNSGTVTADNLTVKENSTTGSGVYLVNTTAAHSFTNSLFDTFAGSRAFFLDGATNVTIQDSIIRNAGFDGIYMENSTGTISGNTIQSNGSSGIYLTGSLTTPSIYSNTITANTTGVYCAASANPVIGGSMVNKNDITANTSYGVRNTTTTLTVDASWNWWGDSSGPYHATTNPSGLGDTVTDYVDYANFIDAAPNSFSFTDVTGASLATVYMDTITVAGINTSAPVSMTTCTSSSCEYRINSDSWVSADGIVSNGDTVSVRQTSSASNATQTNLTLDIGGVSDTFSVTTCVLNTYYRDADNDTFGDPNVTEEACSASPGYVSDNTDCDDSDATEKPGVTWYADADGDTYGNPAFSNTCERGSISDVLDNTDCDDSDATEKPGVTWYADADGDTYGNPSSSSICERGSISDVLDNTDCDDSDATEKPGVIWFADVDGDTYGDPASFTLCERGISSDVLNNSDCDDTHASVHPDAEEICDALDNNCDSMIDENKVCGDDFWNLVLPAILYPKN